MIPVSLNRQPSEPLIIKDVPVRITVRLVAAAGANPGGPVLVVLPLEKLAAGLMLASPVLDGDGVWLVATAGRTFVLSEGGPLGHAFNLATLPAVIHSKPAQLAPASPPPAPVKAPAFDPTA